MNFNKFSLANNLTYAIICEENKYFDINKNKKHQPLGTFQKNLQLK